MPDATAAYATQLEGLRAVYAADLPEKARAISAAAARVAGRWDPGDLEDLYQLVHRLAGSAAIYGFPFVSQTASDLEAFVVAARSEAGAPAAERGLRLRALAAAVDQACTLGCGRAKAPG